MHRKGMIWLTGGNALCPPCAAAHSPEEVHPGIRGARSPRKLLEDRLNYPTRSRIPRSSGLLSCKHHTVASLVTVQVEEVDQDGHIQVQSCHRLLECKRPCWFAEPQLFRRESITRPGKTLRFCQYVRSLTERLHSRTSTSDVVSEPTTDQGYPKQPKTSTNGFKYLRQRLRKGGLAVCGPCCGTKTNYRLREFAIPTSIIPRRLDVWKGWRKYKCFITGLLLTESVTRRRCTTMNHILD